MTTAAPSINWDRKGIGQVPWQIDLDYIGFTRSMTPPAFRALVRPVVSRPGTVEALRPMAAAGEGIAPPFLLVDWDEDKRVWRVHGHEGRSRSRLAPDDEEMPVSVIPRGIRSRHLTDEMRAAVFIPEPL